MKLFEAEANRVHPDKPEDGARTYGLTIVADTKALAEEMCRIHGLEYKGELVAVLEKTPDGILTVYSDDGLSAGAHIDIDSMRTQVLGIVRRIQSANMHTSRHAAFVCDDIMDAIKRELPGGAK